MNRPAISVIGPGKVGMALAELACAAGYPVVALAGRDRARSEAAASRIGPDTRALTPAEAAHAADLVFLTVTDASIEDLARELGEAEALRRDSVLVHCSGALTSEVLAPAKGGRGIAVASFHPLQTFPSVEHAVASLPGSHCFLEGEPRALELLEAFGAAIGVHCVRIETGAKLLYHAGAVIACNYLCALMDAALVATEAAGIARDTAWPALQPLVQATLANIVNLGPGEALTGPIKRGDHETVESHLRALSESAADLVPLYRALGARTLDLAVRSDSLDDASVEALRAAIEGLS